MVLTIHVGLAKTGSTAIQYWLANASKQARHRLTYLGTGNLLSGDGFGFESPGESKRYRSRVFKALTNKRDVVISCEEFLGNAYRMYDGARHHALAMRNYFASYTEFQVVIFLRPQYQWFESLFNEWTKHGREGEPEEVLLPLLESKYARYNRLLDDLLDVFGPDHLVVRAYRPGADVCADFHSLIDLPAHLRPGLLSPQNVSVNAIQAQLLRSIHQVCPDSTHVWEWRWFLENIQGVGAPSKYSLLPECLQERLIELCISDWHSLTTTVQGTRFAKPEVFEALAEEASRATVRPWIGDAANQGEIIREASQALATAIPMIWSRRTKNRGNTACSSAP